MLSPSRRLLLATVTAVLLVALPATGGADPEPVGPVDPRSVAERYADSKEALEARRVRLAGRWDAAEDGTGRQAVVDEARATLIEGIRHRLMPEWFGTPWDFYGMTHTPQGGAIACGYFVSTLLEDAGLRVERNYMAQQASEHIVRTFADRSGVKTLRHVEPSEAVAHVVASGPGLYAVGLSFHTGFLVYDGETDVELCHSAYYGAGRVVCEPAAASQGLSDSGIFVIGPVLTDKTVEAWLRGDAIRTHGH